MRLNRPSLFPMVPIVCDPGCYRLGATMASVEQQTACIGFQLEFFVYLTNL